MLSHKILVRKDIGAAASYYEDAADDYYAKESGGATAWQGEGAEALGLEGEVDSARFRELLAGKVNNDTSTRSSTRQDSKQRIGIDLTFSAPKSVSIQALIGQDPNIIKAHDLAVTRAIELAEKRAQARIKEKNKTRIEQTGNLVVAKFRHETSRELDPQLHTHAIVLNITQRKDGKWRALKNDEIIKMTKYLGAAYRTELAAELTKLGYELRHGRDGMFELASISREQLEAFSQRSAQIDERLAEKGLFRETASSAQKQAATMASRSRKTEITRDELYQDWKARSAELKLDLLKPSSGKMEADNEDLSKMHSELREKVALRSIRFAVNHLTERQAVVTEERLLDVALKHAMGEASLPDITQQLKSSVESGFLVKERPLYRLADEVSTTAARSKEEWIAFAEEKGLTKAAATQRVNSGIQKGYLTATEARYSTQTALERERRILSIELSGRATKVPILDAIVARHRTESSTLTKGQRAAFELITSTDGLVTGVRGLAGTGKSHMLNFTSKQLESEGFTMRALAPYGSQVKSLRELGLEANTLASFLKAKAKNINEKTIVVLDEAGIVPTRQMEQLLVIVRASGARLVLMGDQAQTKAIEAGKPFVQLMEAGMPIAEMKDIQRQKEPILKRAVELAADGRMTESLEKVTAVLQIKEATPRRERIVADYMERTPEQRKETLVVAGTNEARREINSLVRVATGVAGHGKDFDTLIRRDTTQAERRFSKHYRIGDVIQPERDYRKSGLQRGELYTVQETGPGNQLTVKALEGPTITFSPMTHRKLSVYQPERTEISAGDLIRINRNDASLDVANGDRFKVLAVMENSIFLGNDKRTLLIETDKPLHMEHAYATTIHSSQGLTADRVLVEFESNSPTSAKDTFYVAISRARHESIVYTNDEKKLPAAVSRENVKHSALDMNTAYRDRLFRKFGAEQEKKQDDKYARSSPLAQQIFKPRSGQQEKERTKANTGIEASKEMQE